MARFNPVQGTAQVDPAAIEEAAKAADQALTGLASYIRQRFQEFKNHRDRENISKRITDAARQYKGEYSADKLNDIRQFGGSEVYSRLTTVKCRGATAMLRDVFLGNEKTWAVEPTPVPTLPNSIQQSVDQLLGIEMMTLMQGGQPADPTMLQQRRSQLFDAAMQAAVRNAKQDAKRADQYIYDILVEGGFYRAMSDFLVDLPIFPYAVMKGPTVRLTPQVKWVDGVAQEQQVPKMFWGRVAPENIWFTPGASTLDEASVIEKIKVSRADLNSVLGLPGYFDDAIREVLQDYDTGLVDWINSIDTEMADRQSKENPQLNTSELLDTLEFHGPVQGKHLVELGFTPQQIPDEDRDYHVTAWLIGRHIIKVQINPNPKARKPYYMTAFETMPGSLYGAGIPEIITDAQDVANACLRSLVNNMSISSGPQVAINEDRLSASTDANSLYPWKRWRFTSDPMGSQAPPIDFFQPASNAAELLSVYKEMQNIADETSAIPRYITGSEKVGGAASTASGLSMLMNNASKVLQNVAASIDHDVVKPLLQDLYDMILLTDQSGIFRGDESIVVRGVSIAMQRETDRARRLEFLQMTANPIDMGIVGPDGRAKVLRSIADDLGMDGEEIVPNEAELTQRLSIAAQTAMQGQQPEANQVPGPKEASQIMQPEAPV
jgi:hypothetical protein